MSSRFHPDLRLEAAVALLVGAAFFVCGLFLLFWGCVLVGILTGLIHWFVPDHFQASIIGWLVPALCFLSGGVLVYLGRHLLMVYRRWLLRVTWLLDNTQPRKMILTFPQLRGASGRVAELREDGKPQTSEPSETVEIRSPQWKIKDPGGNPVEVFREFEPEGIVVMATSHGIIWGFRKPRGFPDSPTESRVQ
jgi:hypothetical protein